MIDEELLKPTRELLARIDAEIRRQEELAVHDIERYGHGDREYSNQRWHEFYMTVDSLRRERDDVVKVLTDYYALQPTPPTLVSNGNQA